MTKMMVCIFILTLAMGWSNKIFTLLSLALDLKNTIKIWIHNNLGDDIIAQLLINSTTLTTVGFPLLIPLVCTSSYIS